MNEWALDLQNQTAIDVAEALTNLGDPLLLEIAVVIAVVALLFYRRIMEALVLGAGMLMTIAAVQIPRQIVDRPRPPDAVIQIDSPSFPSGHAAYAMAWIALAIVGVRVVPALRGRWWIVLVAAVVPLVVAATRLYLRVHWFSDVARRPGRCGDVLLALRDRRTRRRLRASQCGASMSHRVDNPAGRRVAAACSGSPPGSG